MSRRVLTAFGLDFALLAGIFRWRPERFGGVFSHEQRRAFYGGGDSRCLFFVVGPGDKNPSSTQPASFALSQASPREMVEGRVALNGMGNFRMLNNAWHGSGPLTLVDGRLFSFPSAFGWVEATPGDFLPAFTTQALPQATPVTVLRATPTARRWICCTSLTMSAAK